VATSLGVVLGIYPYFTFAGLSAFALWCVCVAATRYVSVGSMVAALGFPLFYVLLTLRENRQPLSEQLPLTVFATVMALLIVYRHRENIRRLRQGTENKIGKSHSPEARSA
jgi:glycerol-3-phosphate acyltransferase PlsY